MPESTDATYERAPRSVVPLARPWLDDREAAAVSEVVASGWLISGERVAEFERRFAAMHGAAHGIAVNSGSSALIVAMAALGVGEGDEVVVPDLTFISTATACMFLGARPVFCDIEPKRQTLDAAKVESVLTPRTRLIVPVHHAGHAAELGPINAVARSRGIRVLEDAAAAHLVPHHHGRYVGTLGDAGIFSFTPSKTITTGEGGMILTNDGGIAERCRLFSNYGDTGKFDWASLGFNFRMPELMGAIGLHQLDKLHEANAARRRIAATYTKALAAAPEIVCPHPGDEHRSNFQLYSIRLRLERLRITRDAVIAALATRGVISRLYYPPLHRAGVFERFGPFDDTDYPETMAYVESALSLPIYPELTAEQQDLVISSLLDVVSGARR